jgi:two-component system KDP operon response regulator KdpE
MDRRERNTLLLADNTTHYRRSLRSLLELEGYVVEEAGSAEEARQKLAALRIDVALVDLRLTDHADDYDISGLEVAKQATDQGVTSIIITNYPSVHAARLALRSRGVEPLAADFIPKGDGPQAVLDSLRVVMLGLGNEDKVKPGDLVVDLKQGLVWRRGQPVELSRYQYALLEYLYRSQGAVCSPEELLKAVYGEDVPPGQASADKRLDRLVDRLRRKIEDDPSEPRTLIKERGRGYRLAINQDTL